MADNPDFKLPFNSLINYVPQNLRNPVITSLIDNLFDRFLTHDESVPLYGYVGRKPAAPDDRTPLIPQQNPERDINSIVPVLSFKVGTEQVAFTVEDLVKKAEALGVAQGMQWLYSQGNNFLPPIDLDKFTNFFNYYWVAKSVEAVPDLPWNPELKPEYYVIAAPLPTDLNKLNVVAATTATIIRTGTGFEKLKFKVTFSSPTQFTITPIGSLGFYSPVTTNFTLTSNSQHIEYKVTGPAGTLTLVEFDITRDQIYDQFGNSAGTESFEAGDAFTIDVTFLSRNYNVTFSGSYGIKGKISKVKSLNVYQKIDGVTIRAGDRVLVKNASPDESGIYTVAPGVWQRASDFSGSTAVADAAVFVKGGTQNGSTTWKSIAGSNGFGWISVPGANFSNTNHWQEGNFWVRGDQLTQYGLGRSDAVQALRPIIEYAADVQLNGFVKDGAPSDSGDAYKQIKTEFNQLPLFDLFRYDGSHSGLVSSVFYYEPDLTADLDLVLQKRVKKSGNDSADFIFNHGMADSDGKLLFVKRNNVLKSIWHAGYTGPHIVDTYFAGDGNGTISDLEAYEFTQQQIWTLIALTSTTFSVAGSKMKYVPLVATVGTQYVIPDLTFKINAGSTPFVPGDTFMIRVGNLESPRYMMRDAETGELFDMFMGPTFDTAQLGAYQIPRLFYNNPYNDSRSPITEGALYSHFRGILANQVNPAAPIDYSFGGSIKLWSEAQTLLASLLMQRDMTPVSMIDFAQRQYETALNTVRDIFQQHIIQHIADYGPVETLADLDDLVNWILSVRKNDNDVRTVIYDSTSPVVGFPITLPMLGLAELVQPTITFDTVLGRTLLVHHDGHLSPLFIDNLDFRQSVLGDLVSLQIKRPDGTYTPAIGSYTVTAPATPYVGELWVTPDGVMRIWDAGSWKEINLADTLNSVMLRVETRLYEGINPNVRQYEWSDTMADPEFDAQLAKELYTFAAVNEYDPLGPDYDPADPFTWNYSQAIISNFPPLATPTVPARWYNILAAHQATISGVKTTFRPNLEPWKLLGYDDPEIWWNSLSNVQRAEYTPYVQLDGIDGTFTNAGTVRVVQTVAGITPLTGLQVIDSVQLQTGDKVLIVNDTDPAKNGIWNASAGGWGRALTPLVKDTYVTVTDGSFWSNTTWALTATVANLNVDPVVFSQARFWSTKLWDDIKAARPGLRLSVNTATDELLPPYVSASNGHVIDALTLGIPPGVSLSYTFGDGSPVEAVWERSIEYGYSKARALFRYDPLAFLGFGWGFNWVEVDGILFDGFDMQMPGHKRFRLHGELIDTVDRAPLSVLGTGAALIATYDAYDSGRRQNFTVRQAGAVVGHAREGIQSVISGRVFTISDGGVPFRVGDRFEITDNGVTFVPVTTHRIQGFGQIFTQALREVSIDTQSSYAVSAFREWDINMGYRAGGLVATDDLVVYTDADTLSPSAYTLLFKKNQIARNEWAQALRITVAQFGDYTEAEVSGNVPVGSGADWIFRVEGYNPRYLDISYYVMGGDTVTFNALSGAHTSIPWLEPTHVTSVVTTQLPLSITGIQNVVNFLYGYQRYLEDRGWEFNARSEFNIDAETGRVRNFQLEIEKFVDRMYAGIKAGEGHVVNPFIDRAWFNQETGLLSEFIDTSLFDITGHPGVFDILGVKYKKDDLDVVRTNVQSSFGAAGPMFSAHIQTDDFEHLFIFNNYSQPSTESGLLYDPFSGGRIATYKFNGRKQATNTFRPEFGGHFLVGNEVHQNIQASTDNVANFYDANRAFENETTTRHSLALLGFSEKQYFNDLDISSKTQFNFWRGLIQSKGTNLSVSAYLNNNRFDDAKIDEYWAYKVAEYGDARQHTFPELKLNVNDALTQFTQLQFDAAEPLIGFTQINRFDEERWFTLEDMDQDAYFQAEEVGRYVRLDTADGQIFKLPFIADNLQGTGFVQLNATTIQASHVSPGGGSPGTDDITIIGRGPARPRFNPVKLFNYVDEELVEEIPMWHPAAGVHTPTALESINIISNQNPARYNYSTEVLNNNTYDPLRPWGTNEVGRVWFDTRNLAYLPYYDDFIFPSLDERLSRWGTLADFATVDVYEWVQSAVPPAEYNLLAQEQAGDADLDANTKAAGEVANLQTYSRDRTWFMRPIAWSFSPIPEDVDWEDKPPFPGGSTMADLSMHGGLAVLRKGTFDEYGIVAGMRLGGWNRDPDEPKPTSEYLIEDEFTKEFKFASTAPVAVVSTTENQRIAGTVAVVPNGHSSISGQLLFTKVPNSIVPTDTDEDGNATSWDVQSPIRVTEVGSGETEYVVITSTVGAVAEVKAVAGSPGQAAIAPTAGSPATTGAGAYQVIYMSPSVSASTPTGFPNDNTQYAADISIDAVLYGIFLYGNEAQTVGQMLATMNAKVAAQHAGLNPFSIKEGNIVLTSPSTNPANSYAYYTSNPDSIIHQLAAFSGFGPAVGATAPTPAVAPTLGQAYVAPVAAVAYVPAPYLHGAKISVVAGEKITVNFPEFGFDVEVRATTGGTYEADALRNTIVAGLQDYVTAYDAVVVSPVVEANPLETEFTNDPTSINDVRHGWRVWNVPTQAQLTNDSKQPVASWRPYVGDLLQVDGTQALVQAAVDYADAPLTLNDDTVIERYASTWSNWKIVSNVNMTFPKYDSNVDYTATRSGTAVTFTYVDRLDPERVSVYVNGIAQLKAAFTIDGKVLTIANVSQPSEVTVIIRKYEPTEKELAFDPDVEDVLTFQTQYKQDYEYVALPVRDREGALTSTLYFFWVKNKTTAALGKKLSVQAMAQELRDGPTNYLTFQHFLGTGTLSDPFRYDAITISGLSYVVTKDDTFKLRFTRNFTLRDDPEELKLKNTHAEWSLMRPGQKTRVPEQLWSKLTDSVAGADAAGNPVPALRRVLYDERNGTRTQFGFGSEQTLGPSELLRSSITYTILNTKLTDKAGNTIVPDYISILDLNESDSWFADAASARRTMTDIWNSAKVSQVNEIFFAALDDVLANNYELSDIFKTSRLSAYSIKVVRPVPVAGSYE